MAVSRWSAADGRHDVDGGGDGKANRRGARARVSDGSWVVSARELAAARRGLTRARQAFAGATRALRAGRPVSAAARHEVAWRQAFGVLAGLGVTYRGDRDGDGVLDIVELRLGASPLRADTDGDGLGDAFEVDAVPWVLPGAGDTDGDGAGDAAGDIDEDGLSNGAEQRAGTDPLEPDTDGDVAPDAAEVAAGTDPRDADSDGDTLPDGFEPRAGLDPLRRDTDGDGVTDDRDVTQVTVEGPGRARVRLTGIGDVAASFVIEDVTGGGASVAGSVPGIAGDAVELSLAEQDLPRLAGAMLTLPYDEADPRVGDPGDLRVFYLDQQQGRWRPAEGAQNVDRAAGTVSVALEHFSTYAVFDSARWARFWAALGNPCLGRAPGGGTDVVLLDLSLVLDSSGSMGTFDPDGLRKDAATSFVNGLLPDDRAAVVDFDDTAYVVQGLTSDKAALRRAIGTIDDAGGSNIAAGVEVGTDVLLGNGDPARGRVAVLLTDGRGDYDPTLTERARAAGIVIYTIGLGPKVDAGLLRGIAEGTGGTYLPVAQATDLPDAFDRVAQVAGSDPAAGRDSDGDGLNDCQEIRGWYDPYGNRFTSNPLAADTDGDGLTDAEEAGEPLAVTAATSPGARTTFAAPPKDPPTRTAPSDPTRADRDGDDLSDADEYDMGLPALDWDTDRDNIFDGQEIELGTDPQNRDSDGDGFTDGYEHTHPDKGLNPTIADKRVSRWTYVKDFSVGLVLGEFKPIGSLSWLTGCLLAGASSAIPVFGWVTGTVADVRDALGSLLHGDWVGAGLSVAGLLPYAGDAVNIVGKVARFTERNPRLIKGAMYVIAKQRKLPSRLRNLAIRAADPVSFGLLKSHGFTDDTIHRLALGRHGLADVADAVAGSLPSRWGVAGVMSHWTKGEEWLQSALGATKRGTDFQVFQRGLTGQTFMGMTFRGGRVTDVLKSQIAHESKVGRQDLTSAIRGQLIKDLWLLEKGQIDGIHWHFMISAATDSVGPSKRLLTFLVDHDITYTIHVA